MLEPEPRTATSRRRVRGEVRDALGTSRDDAPSAEQVVRAAGWLDNLLHEASNGRLRLQIVDTEEGRYLTVPEARRVARGEEG